MTDALSAAVDPAGRLSFTVADLTLIRPARDGALRVPRVATEAGVRRHTAGDYVA